MYPGEGGVFWLIISAIIIWMLVLSYFIWKSNLFLRKLFPGKQGDIKDKIVEALMAVNKLEAFRKQNLENIQKVYLKRYNPYHDTGGDQSFSLGLLDGNGTGFVLTSLHSRSGTRVFAKPVQAGKEDGFQFSEEEAEVVNKAVS